MRPWGIAVLVSSVCVVAVGSSSPSSLAWVGRDSGLHAGYVLPPAAGSAPFPACPAVGVIGSRGSGESPGSSGWDLGLGPPSYAFAIALGRLLPGVEYTYNAPPGYAAVGASTVLTNKQKYLDSVLGGEVQLLALIRDERTKCPSTKLILAGYSQGAELVGDAYLVAIRKKSVFNSIVGVVLFGDPLYNHNDSSTGQTARQQKTQTVLTQNGVLTEHGPYYIAPPHSFPASTVGRVLSYCISKDPICQGVIGNSPFNGEHSLYPDVGDPEDAAQYVAKLIKKSAAHLSAVPVVSCPTILGSGTSAAAPKSYSVALPPGGDKQALSAFASSGLVVVGPRGWTCRAIVGADGGQVVEISPSEKPADFKSAPFEYPHPAAIEASLVPGCAGCKANTICPFFPAAANHLGFPCATGIPSGEKVTRLSAQVVAFEDPPLVHGTGGTREGALMFFGVVVFIPDSPTFQGWAASETCAIPVSVLWVCSVAQSAFVKEEGHP